MTSNRSSASVSVNSKLGVWSVLVTDRKKSRLTKLKVTDNQIDRVEDGEKVSRISFTIHGLDVTNNKLTRHELNSFCKRKKLKAMIIPYPAATCSCHGYLVDGV